MLETLNIPNLQGLFSLKPQLTRVPGNPQSTLAPNHGLGVRQLQVRPGSFGAVGFIPDRRELARY